MKHGGFAFTEWKYTFQCPDCKRKGNEKCPHDDEVRPDWNPDTARAVVEHMMRDDQETFDVEVNARGSNRSAQILNQTAVKRVFDEVSHPTKNLDSPHFFPSYVFLSIDPNTGRLIDRNAPSVSNYAMVSFYSIPGAYVYLGAEDIDCGDVNQFLPPIIEHVRRLANHPQLKHAKFVVITENRSGHESSRLRDDFKAQPFVQAMDMYYMALGKTHRQGIPTDENIKRSCIFNFATMFDGNAVYFDRSFFSVHAESMSADTLGGLTPAAYVKREMKKQFENFSAIRNPSTKIGVDPVIKYTGKIAPNARDDLFMASAIGMYFAKVFENNSQYEHLRI